MRLPATNALYCVGILTLLLGLSCIDIGHNWSDDFALYLQQTQALWEGNTEDLLKANYFAMEHSYAHVGPYLYPNGFPILLLPIYLIFGLNFWVLKVYCLLFLIASIPFIYAIFKQFGCSTPKALAITFLVVINYHFIRFSDHILSDLPFFFFSLWSYYHLQRKQYNSYFQSIFLGILIFFTYNIRDIGIVLLPCLFAYQWQQFKTAKKASLGIYLLPYISFVCLWLMRWYWSPSVSTKQLSLLSETSLDIIINNFYYYFLLVGNYFLIFRNIPTSIALVVACFFSSLILLGIYQKGNAHLPLLVYLGGTISICLIWVSFQGMRFLFPVLPFLIYFLLEGIKGLPIAPKFQKYIIIGLLLSSLSQSLLTSYHYWQKDTNEAYSIELQQIYQYIKNNTPKEAIIVFYKPRALRLFTQRNAVQKDISTAHYNLKKRTHSLLPTDSILLKTEHYILTYKKTR